MAGRFQSQEPYYLARFGTALGYNEGSFYHLVRRGEIRSETCSQSLSPRREGDMSGDEPLVLRRITRVTIWTFTPDRVREIIDARYYSRLSADEILLSALGEDS